MCGLEMWMVRLGCLACLVVIGSACADPCDDPVNRRISLAELPCNMTNAEGVWESHPFPPIADEQCLWLDFPGCATYEIEHPLGRVPTLAVGYTSFVPNGEFSTVGSGNSFIVSEASDETIVVRNAQNQFFYLRLVLE